MSMSEAYLAESHLYIFRTDNQQVLTRDVDGFEAAKTKANHLRRQLGLKWDQVKFKVQKKAGGSSGYSASSSTKRGLEYSPRYNPSKRGHFRGYYDHDGNFHDLD